MPSASSSLRSQRKNFYPKPSSDLATDFQGLFTPLARMALLLFQVHILTHKFIGLGLAVHDNMLVLQLFVHGLRQYSTEQQSTVASCSLTVLTEGGGSGAQM